MTEKKQYYQSPRWSKEITDCSMPMTFDQYNKCAYGCLYCFSTFQRAVGGASKSYHSAEVNAVNMEKCKKIFSGEPSQFQPYILAKKVFQWGGLSDPFCNFERKYGVGLELLRHLKGLNYPICFSTKGTWWLEDPRYVELFKGQKNWNVKVSIITGDEKKAHIIEPGVPTPAERLRAIESIAKLDCGGATLRLRPFIIGISNPTHTELIKCAGSLGANALSTEFFCLEVRSTILRKRLKVMSDVAGMDLFEFYKRYSSGVGYLRLNRNVKREFVMEMEEAAHEAGMRFYVSDAHFKERCANGSCCGLDTSWNYSRGQFCEALQICKNRGSVRWSDIAADLEYAKAFEWTKAEGYNTNSAEQRAKFSGQAMYDFLRWCWNTPKSGESPFKMFEGIMKPNGQDESGNLIYEYDATRG
jgi:DNA repair photolyase